MVQIDEIIAEADQYTDYCRLLAYGAAKSEEYITKAAQQVLSTAGLVTAMFPLVGSTIVAGKAAVAQALIAVAEPLQGAAAAVSIASKLSELEMPEGGCI